MRRSIAVVLVILLLAPLSVAGEPLKEYVPYQEGEFPLWTYKIQRAEQIFFGSMIITIPAAALIYSLAVNNNVLAQPTSQGQAYLVSGAIAASLSLSISIADYVIGEVRKP